MSSILVVDPDPVFGAVLEDRLHVAGHDVVWLRDGERAEESAARTGADLLILEIAGPRDLALATVTALRERPENRALPILALSERNESADRVAALRAGVDDYVSKPCDLEELLLRAERLVGSRAVPGQRLQGDLDSHPIWELVQYLQAAKTTGDLTLRSDNVSGRIRLADGRILSARWSEIDGRQALLTIFGLKRGRFQLVTDATDDAVSGEPLPANEVMMEAAWIEDELEKLRDFLPVSGTPLHAVDAELSEPGEEFQFAGLPIEAVLDKVRAEPGIRIYDLVHVGGLAPQAKRLAIAWLIREGLLVPASASAAFPTTIEIQSSELLEMSVTEYLAHARVAGFGSTALPLALLVEPGNLERLVALLESAPGFRRNEALRGFASQLRDEGGGSVAFASDLGKLIVHARTVRAADLDPLEALVTVSAGVLLWLDVGEEIETLQRIVQRLGQVKGEAVGVLVAHEPGAHPLLESLTRDASRWRTSSHSPQSLLGILRLLQHDIKNTQGS